LPHLDSLPSGLRGFLMGWLINNHTRGVEVLVVLKFVCVNFGYGCSGIDVGFECETGFVFCCEFVSVGSLSFGLLSDRSLD
jgi:hypothetical protein